MRGHRLKMRYRRGGQFISHATSFERSIPVEAETHVVSSAVVPVPIPFSMEPENFNLKDRTSGCEAEDEPVDRDASDAMVSDESDDCQAFCEDNAGNPVFYEGEDGFVNFEICENLEEHFDGHV